MYYLIDFDSLDVTHQHAKKAELTAYVRANDLILATEIVRNPDEIVNYLTKKEMITLYENITLESLPVHLAPSIIGGMVFDAIVNETYPEPTGKATPTTEEAVKPEPKPKPQTTKPATGNKVVIINTKTLQASTIGLGSVQPVKRIHKQICDTLEGSDMGYTKLMEELVFELGKTEKLLKGYVTDGIRRDILTMENPDEL